MSKRKKPEQPSDPKDATREALDFCFEDVSSLRMLGASPLSDLSSGPGPAAPASSAAPAGRRTGGQRWNLLMLAALVLTLGAATAVLLLGR